MIKFMYKIIFVVCISFVLTGCVKKEILDDINLIEAIGFDHSDDTETIGTILYPIYQPEKPPENRTLTAKAHIKKSILQELQLQSANPIVTGSMEIVLFGKELATNEGVLELIDPFQRDPGVGSGLYLAVVDGQAKELMEGEYGIRGNATHLSNLIKTNIENEDLPKTNLHKFLSAYYQKGKTPFMPQVKQLSKDKVLLNGICFFKHGKVVQTISPKEMFFFRLLVDKYSNGLHRVKIDEGEAAIRSIRSVHVFKLTNRAPMEIIVQLKVHGIINEFTGNKADPPIIKKLEKAFEEEITEQCLMLIDDFKEKKIDPVGFGHFVKTRTRKCDLSDWTDTQFQNLTVKIKPDVTIVEAGVIE
ncbi:Ger(x)C family spore germination protein [Robertmurraya massiliosenegalensis]|uniref:Ger(x)C family spore germination protein n=1 Tax=Robertmurraya massiliosenegalensis TaxID=1287657 RepID=UPI0002D958CD|nr:Ger(x)C family spore germination protein [Robertmurraya massiliosenegalensis]